jgi:hypothetical protein
MAPRKKMTSEEPVVLPKNEIKVETPFEKVKKTAVGRKPEPKIVAKAEKVGQLAISAQVTEEKPKPKPETPSFLTPPQTNRGALILGGGLLLMGIVLLLGRLLSIPFGGFMWPFIFIIPGALIFLSALASDNSSGEGLSILGAILTALGLVFLAQQVTGLWASWAYAWALIAPTSIGVAQIVYGTRKDRDTIVKSGRKLVNIGGLMFAIGFVFFELVLGINNLGGDYLNSFRLPVGLILVGLIVLVRSLTKKR